MPFELAGMTEICGAVVGVRVVGVSDWVGVRVPFRMTGGVEAMDCDSVVLVCDAAVLACCAVVVACNTVGFSDVELSATGTGMLAGGAVVVVCDAVGFSDTELSTAGTGVLACDMMLPSCGWCRGD